MKKISCIAVDDEPLALQVLENFCTRIPQLELKSFNNPLLALKYLQEQPVDLLFLDINMPEMMGMELAAAAAKFPYIIFTTAYSDYVLDSFKFNTVDYLLKPYNFERFNQAVDKVIKLLHTDHSEQNIIVKIDYQSICIPIKKILFIEAMGNYLKIYTKSQTYLPQMTMKNIEALLPSPQFVRIHRSYIVNRNAVDSFNQRELYLSGHRLSIGKSYVDILNF